MRPDGRVATRNYVGVLSTVNCSATVSKYVADAFKGEALAAYPNIDGVVALTHTAGCGMDTSGEGMDILRRTLAGYARHANFAGVLIIGLGCEANQMDALFFTQGLAQGPLLRAMTIQDKGGTAKPVAEGIAMVKEMPRSPTTSSDQRRRADQVGLQWRLGRLLGHHRESRAGCGS